MYECNELGLHDFVKIKETQSGFVDRCHRCGKRENYSRTTQGRIDNNRYRDNHLRDFLQPYGTQEKLYRRVYGEPEKIPEKKSKQQIKEEWAQTREDALKMDEKLKRRFID